MSEAVQNLLTLAESLNSKAIILLVQEEAGLLAILHIYHIADTIFNDFNLGIKRFADEAFHALHALLQADLGVTALVNAADGNAILSQDFLQLVQNDRLETVNAQSQGFDYQNIGKLVDDDTRQEICLTEDQAAAGSVYGCFAVLPGVTDTHLNESVIDYGIFFAGHHTDGDFGTGVDKALAHRIAVKVRNENHITVLERSLNFVNLVIIDPGTAGLQGAAFAFF